MNVLVSSIAVAICAVRTLAQTPMPVTTTWEVSSNNGVSWQAGSVQVPQSQASVLVRHVVTWGTPGQGDYLRNGLVVPRVTTIGQIGLGDTASEVRVRQIAMIARPTGAGLRFSPNELIVSGRALPPPNGALSFAGFDPILGTTFSANPVDVVQFRLHLDGTTGERVLSDWVAGNTTYRVVSAAVPEPYQYTFTHNPTSLIVVPAPAALALAGVGGVVLLRRRR